MIAILVIMVILAVLMAVCLLALVDQYRTLDIIRRDLGINDTPQPVSYPQSAPVSPSGIGLPFHLNNRRRVIVLFLSTTCSTCRGIASALHGFVPDDLWIVVESRSEETAIGWLGGVGMEIGAVTYDQGAIASQLELDITPAAFIYEDGTLIRAQTVPSFRQLKLLLGTEVTASASTA